MNEQVIYNLVANALAKLISDGVKMKNVSLDTGLSSSTLYKFMRQDTTYPRFHTVMAVLEYLGFEVTIGRAKRGAMSRLPGKAESAKSQLLQ